MDARGFTLMEVLVVLGITSILAGVALWGVRAWRPDLELQSAARQIVLDLRLARAQAMADHVSRRLAFDPSADTYRRQTRSAGSWADAGSPIALPPGVDVADCSAAGQAIAFSSRGTASTFGNVALRAASGRELLVVVDIVGRVRVQ